MDAPELELELSYLLVCMQAFDISNQQIDHMIVLFGSNLLARTSSFGWLLWTQFLSKMLLDQSWERWVSKTQAEQIHQRFVLLSIYLVVVQRNVPDADHQLNPAYC
jgi:hypothetical protein